MQRLSQNFYIHHRSPRERNLPDSPRREEAEEYLSSHPDKAMCRRRALVQTVITLFVIKLHTLSFAC